MNLTFRPLPRWPYPEQPHRPPLYKATYSDTLGILEREVDALEGSEVIIGLVIDPSSIRLDGRLYANAKPSHPGVEVSFEVGGRRLVFHSDVHHQTSKWVDGGPAREPWKDNLRAIALGLEALRAVSRYGITTGIGQQYAGFLRLETGAADPERGRRLVDEAGGITNALKRWHPDNPKGDARLFADVQAFRETQAAVLR